MASTLRQVASNIQLILQQQKDDNQITFSQICFWVNYFVSKFTYQKIQKYDTGLTLSIYTNIPVLRAKADANPNIVAGRQYFLLPETIYDINGDSGIDYITYDLGDECTPEFTSVTFQRTTPSKAKRLYYSKYETPTPSNPYFYRVGNYIYLLGVECIDIPYLEMGLKTVFDAFKQCGLDEPLPIGEDMIADITKQCLEIGRFALLVPVDMTNTGSENVSPDAAPKQRITSVNDQQLIDQQYQQQQTE